MATQSNSKGLFFFIFIIVLGIGGAWASNLYVKEQLPLVDSAKESALTGGRKLFTALASYPTATARDECVEKLKTPSKGMWKGVNNAVLWEQEFEAPGVKKEMLDWYAAKLQPEGWKIWDTSDTSELHTQWCKPNWLLTIQHNVRFDQPPSYRFTLRLEWMWNFTDRCPLPK